VFQQPFAPWAFTAVWVSSPLLVHLLLLEQPELCSPQEPFYCLQKVLWHHLQQP